DASGARSKFRSVTLAPKFFPQPPRGRGAADGTSVRVAAGMLGEMVDKTLFAVSSDETRFNLSGVFLSTPEAGTLRMVATDGHRLALVDRRVPEGKLFPGVIMPRKGLLEARELLDENGDEGGTLGVSAKEVRLAAPSR